MFLTRASARTSSPCLFPPRARRREKILRKRRRLLRLSAHQTANLYARPGFPLDDQLSVAPGLAGRISETNGTLTLSSQAFLPLHRSRKGATRESLPTA